MLLWGLNRLLERLVAEPPEQIRLRLARRELHRLLEEGHEEGILHPSQVALARGIFAVANDPVTRYAIPPAEIARARANMTKAEVCRLARRLQIPDVPVEGSDGARLAGYVRVIDLELGGSDDLGPVRPLLEIPSTARHIEALMRMQSAHENIAQIVDARGEPLGLILASRLREPLFRGER
jgi:CBS domain containing-hemolysin-like protein